MPAVTFSGTGWPATSIIKSLKYKERVYSKIIDTPGADGVTVNHLGANPEDFLSVEGFHSGANIAAALATAVTTPGNLELITVTSATLTELAGSNWRLMSFESGHEIDGLSHFSAELKRSATITAVASAS